MRDGTNLAEADGTVSDVIVIIMQKSKWRSWPYHHRGMLSRAFGKSDPRRNRNY